MRRTFSQLFQILPQGFSVEFFHSPTTNSQTDQYIIYIWQGDQLFLNSDWLGLDDPLDDLVKCLAEKLSVDSKLSA